MITKSIRSIIVSIMMGFSAYCGSLIFQCIYLWLAFISPKAFRWYIDITMFMWICSSISLMEWIIGIKFRLYGDNIKSSERAIFIMNHRTRLDWLYFYGILMRHGSSLRDEKIVLKNDLKRIPGPGWAMQCGSYIFLDRKLENDKYHLTNMIEYLSSVGHNTKILLFPEGTDLCKSSRDRSNKFADKMGWQHYQNVLYPRTAGFVHITEEMIRCFPDFDAIYDITAAYPDEGFATNEIEFLKGLSSSEVHFHCRRYSLKEITGNQGQLMKPIDGEDVSAKLKVFIGKVWDAKENILQNYYENKQFTDCELLSVNSAEVQMESVFMKQVVSVFLIIGNIFACIYVLFVIPKVSIPVFFVLNVIFIYIDMIQHGVDELVMKLSLREKYRLFRHYSKDDTEVDSRHNNKVKEN